MANDKGEDRQESPELQEQENTNNLSKPLEDSDVYEADLERAHGFAEKSRAHNTKRAYRADWSLFQEWCKERGVIPLPATPETVSTYIASVAHKYKLSSLERKLSAISQAHKTAGYDSPALSSEEPLHSVWSGIVREKGRSKDKAAPALTEDIRLMIDSLPTKEESSNQLTLSSLRDRAIILIGFTGALRRSEIINLDTGDINFVAEGIRLVVRKSKSDQEGHGHVKGIRYGDKPRTCPVRSIRAWINKAEIEEGPLFRSVDRWGNIGDSRLSGRSVANIVKRAAKDAGLDHDQYSGHSLRAGFTTQAARAGLPERVIMRHTGHESERMVREYIREGQLFEENPTEELGL